MRGANVYSVADGRAFLDDLGEKREEGTPSTWEEDDGLIDGTESTWALGRHEGH